MGTAELWSVPRATFLQVVGEQSATVRFLWERHNLMSVTHFTEFEPEKYIGRGGFGEVLLVKHKITEHQYALKCVKKSGLDETEAEALRRETAFHDSKMLYFITEIIAGGDLLDALDLLGVLKNKQGQFYIGSLVVAFEYLHHKYIAYRDLKPENIMLSKDGYMKLIDFGLAKALSS